MDKRSIFGLDPDQLNELLSLGSDVEDPAGDPGKGQETGPDAASREESSPEHARVMENQATASVTDAERPGGRIGRYKLLRVLGEGGMGMVYLAEQEGQIRRKVALKVIKPGMDSKRVIARFENERQALALLDHPNIAQVYDAGTTKTGRPYFVMEHVKGSPITEYCDRHKLSIEDRLTLFQQICHAVHHAHQKGIIHRDIKPSNILVSTEGDTAVPKIIDFGVAKAIATPLTERTLFTEDTQLLGTPEYMSPEQADLAGEDIDTRSDIYSLGVLLYVLLAGILPYDSETFREGGVEHIRKIIRETDPKTPSTRLTKLGKEAVKLAESRRTELAALAKCLHRELEWIPLRAMRKDRSERYRSAVELADDIGNYLSGAPLTAGPPTTVYRFKKLVRRNAVLSAAVLAVAVTLFLGLTATTAMYLRAEGALDKEARARAQAQEATQRAELAALDATRAAERETAARVQAEKAGAEAQMISAFLTQVVLGSAPRSVKGRDATVLEILDVASEQIGAYFTSEPNVEAHIQNVLSWTYWHLGDFKTSALHQERRYHILQEQGSPAGIAMNWVGVFSYFAGDYAEAERLFDTLRLKRIRKNGDAPPWLKCNLANARLGQGRYQEAEELFLQVFNESAGWDPNHPGTMYERDLATIWREQGRYEESEKLFVAVLNTQRAQWGAKGDADGEMTRCMNELARLYVIQGRCDEAEALFDEGIALGDNYWPGKDHPFTMRHVNGLGVLRTKQGRFEEAEALLNRALEGRKRKLGENHPYTLETINDLGLLRLARQRYDEAEDLLTKALERRTTKLGRNHPHTLETVHELGVLYLVQSRYEDAQRRLLEALRGRESKLGPAHPHTLDSLRELVTLYEAWNKPDEAEKWRVKLPRHGGAEQ